MMILKTGIAIAALLIMLSCDKEDADNRSAEELLTKEGWTLYAAGYDDNRNGKIDSSENILGVCQQDNQYHFFKNGTGTIAEGIHLCDPATHTEFNWRFENAAAEILINHQLFSISTLGHNRMQLIAKIPWLTTGFVTEYKH